VEDYGSTPCFGHFYLHIASRILALTGSASSVEDSKFMNKAIKGLNRIRLANERAPKLFYE